MDKFTAWLADNRYSFAAFGRALGEHMKKGKPVSYQTVASWANGTTVPRPAIKKAISEFTKKAVPVSAWQTPTP